MDIYHVRTNIRSLRKQKGITQKEIATRLFMDERTYAKIERGEKKSMDIRLLASIADILGTEVQQLMQPSDPAGQMPELPPQEEEAVIQKVTFEHIALLQQNQMMIMMEMKGLEEKINRLLATHSAALDLIKTTVA